MKNSQRTLWICITVIAQFSIWVLSIGVASGAGPGVSLRVIDTKVEDQAERGKLWLKAKPGERSVKALAISNSTGARQKVSLSIVPAIIDGNGKLIEQDDKKLNLMNLVTFTPRTFILAPGEIKKVTMTLSPKKNSKLDFWDALVIVNSESTSQISKSDGILKLPIAFKVNYPAKIGIGNFDQLSYIFSVEDVKATTSKTFEKFLTVSMKNQGNIPMIFMGQATLVDVNFRNISYGPYPFRSKTTNPNAQKEFSVLLPRDFPEGDYRVLVDVNNGKRNIQAIREVRLEFQKPTSLIEKLLLGFLFVFFTFILVISLNYLITGRNLIRLFIAKISQIYTANSPIQLVVKQSNDLNIESSSANEGKNYTEESKDSISNQDIKEINGAQKAKKRRTKPKTERKKVKKAKMGK